MTVGALKLQSAPRVTPPAAPDMETLRQKSNEPRATWRRQERVGKERRPTTFADRPDEQDVARCGSAIHSDQNQHHHHERANQHDWDDLSASFSLPS